MGSGSGGVVPELLLCYGSLDASRADPGLEIDGARSQACGAARSVSEVGFHDKASR